MCTPLTRSLTGAGDHVELDDLLSPLKKMKSFRSLQKRLVSASLSFTVCATDEIYLTRTYDPWVQVVACMCAQVHTATSTVHGCVANYVHVCLIVASAACACACACVNVHWMRYSPSSPAQKLVQEDSSKLEAPLPKVHADRVSPTASSRTTLLMSTGCLVYAAQHQYTLLYTNTGGVYSTVLRIQPTLQTMLPLKQRDHVKCYVLFCVHSFSAVQRIRRCPNRCLSGCQPSRGTEK